MREGLSKKFWTPLFWFPQIQIFGPHGTNMFEIYGPPLKYSIPPQLLLLTPFARIQRGVQIFQLNLPVYINLALTCCIQLTTPVSIRESDKNIWTPSEIFWSIKSRATELEKAISLNHTNL